MTVIPGVLSRMCILLNHDTWWQKLDSDVKWTLCMTKFFDRVEGDTRTEKKGF